MQFLKYIKELYVGICTRRSQAGCDEYIWAFVLVTSSIDVVAVVVAAESCLVGCNVVVVATLP